MAGRSPVYVENFSFSPAWNAAAPTLKTSCFESTAAFVPVALPSGVFAR